MVLSAKMPQKGKATRGARATSVNVWRLAWMPRFCPHVERRSLADRPRASVEGMSSTRIIGKTKKDTTLQRVPSVILANHPRRSSSPLITRWAMVEMIDQLIILSSRHDAARRPLRIVGSPPASRSKAALTRAALKNIDMNTTKPVTAAINRNPGACGSEAISCSSGTLVRATSERIVGNATAVTARSDVTAENTGNNNSSLSARRTSQQALASLAEMRNFPAIGTRLGQSRGRTCDLSRSPGRPAPRGWAPLWTLGRVSVRYSRARKRRLGRAHQSLPQQTTVPSERTPQECLEPAETEIQALLEKHALADQYRGRRFGPPLCSRLAGLVGSGRRSA